jgi:hypothetical protein
MEICQTLISSLKESLREMESFQKKLLDDPIHTNYLIELLALSRLMGRLQAVIDLSDVVSLEK